MCGIAMARVYLNGEYEYATPIWGVNTALAKDDVQSRILVVNIIK